MQDHRKRREPFRLAVNPIWLTAVALALALAITVPAQLVNSNGGQVAKSGLSFGGGRSQALSGSVVIGSIIPLNAQTLTAGNGTRINGSVIVRSASENAVRNWMMYE